MIMPQAEQVFVQTRVIHIDRGADVAVRPRPAWLSAAVRAMRGGKLVCFPTETVYGIGAVATDAGAVERLRELKDRPSSPFTVHLGEPAQAGRYVRDIPAAARLLMGRAWPGPLTVLLTAGERFADSRLGGKAVWRRVCPEGVVGLRCPDDDETRALLSRVARPVLATSANLAGRPAATSAEEVLAQLDGRIDLLLDGGPCRQGVASTIVAFEGGRHSIVRAGGYDARQIARMMRLSVLLVCTGNTCRSPMAEGLARKVLAERLGCRADELRGLGVEVRSAGVGAGDGMRASEQAVKAAAARGADISRHRSRRLTKELINSADLIFCMTRRHVADVTGMATGAAGKVELLDPSGDVADPIGGDAALYERVAGRIERNLRERMKEKLP